MGRAVGELNRLACGDGPNLQFPVLVAGDIFDKSNPPHELTNWAIKHLPKMYAVPGNHDAPMHNLKDLHKSAYWTLVEAGVIINLEPGKPIEVGQLRLHGFPFGHPVTPLEHKRGDLMLDVAVIHSFIWTKSTGYEGAPEDQKLSAWRERLSGFDVACLGDNHCPVVSQRERLTIINCGSLMRRTISQADYKPAVWLLRSDGSVEPHYLDISKDRLDVGEAKGIVGKGINVEGFVSELLALGDSAISFAEAVKRTMDSEKVPDEVRAIVLQAMENRKG